MQGKDFNEENNKLIRNTFIIVVVLMACLLCISMIIRNRTSNIVNDVDDKKSVTASVIFDDVKIIANDDIFSHEAIQRANENSGHINYLKHAVKQGDTCICISNSIGVEMLLMTKLVGQSGRIYGYNPYEKYTSTIMQSAEQNGFSARLKLGTFAVSDEVFDGLLVYKNNFPILSGDIHPATYKVPAGQSAMDIKVSTLDTLLPNIQNVNWIKIDSRNSSKVLRGANKLISRSKDVVIVITEYTTKDIEYLSDFIDKFKFKLFVVQQDGSLLRSDVKELKQHKNSCIILKK